MGPLEGPRLSRISILFLISTIIPSIQASSLFPRQAQQCGAVPGLQQCGGEFPSDFCCGQGLTCAQINTTEVKSVICCPKGQSCDSIQPVPCDVSLYNATLHPDNQIHMSDTKDVKLSQCGASCCPLGYACNGGICSANKEKPSSSSSSPTSSTSAASQSSNCSAAPAVQTSSGFDGKSFAAGFFPGMLIGALGVLSVVWVVKKKRDSDKNRYSGDFGHVARTISDPIYDPMHAARTDFVRSYSTNSAPSMQKNIGTRAAGGSANGGNGGGGLTPRIKSMWDRTPKLGIGVWSGLPSTPPPVVRTGESNPYRTPGQTPRQQTPEPASSDRTHSKRRKKSKGRYPVTTQSASSETIDVLMPAPSFLEPPKLQGMRENRFTQDSGHTTFTKLMERAGYGIDATNDVRNFHSSPGHAR